MLMTILNKPTALVAGAALGCEDYLSLKCWSHSYETIRICGIQTDKEKWHTLL